MAKAPQSVKNQKRELEELLARRKQLQKLQSDLPVKKAEYRAWVEDSLFHEKRFEISYKNKNGTTIPYIEHKTAGDIITMQTQYIEQIFNYLAQKEADAPKQSLMGETIKQHDYSISELKNFVAYVFFKKSILQVDHKIKYLANTLKDWSEDVSITEDSLKEDIAGILSDL